MYRLSLGLSSCLPFFLFHNVCLFVRVSVHAQVQKWVQYIYIFFNNKRDTLC